jgi:hypothetical protein
MPMMTMMRRGGEWMTVGRVMMMRRGGAGRGGCWGWWRCWRRRRRRRRRHLLHHGARHRDGVARARDAGHGAGAEAGAVHDHLPTVDGVSIVV